MVAICRLDLGECDPETVCINPGVSIEWWRAENLATKTDFREIIHKDLPTKLKMIAEIYRADTRDGCWSKVYRTLFQPCNNPVR